MDVKAARFNEGSECAEHKKNIKKDEGTFLDLEIAHQQFICCVKGLRNDDIDTVSASGFFLYKLWRRKKVLQI